MARGNSNLNQNDLDNLASLFDAYYDASMNASQMMIVDDTDPQVAAAVEQMHNQYNNLKNKLESNIVNERSQMAAGLNQTRSNNRVMLLMYFIVIILFARKRSIFL